MFDLDTFHMHTSRKGNISNLMRLNISLQQLMCGIFKSAAGPGTGVC